MSRQSMEGRKNKIVGLAAAVSASVPTIWNTLPHDLRSADTREQFKRKLKNWLFEYAYGSTGTYDRRGRKAYCINRLNYLLTSYHARHTLYTVN